MGKHIWFTNEKYSLTQLDWEIRQEILSHRANLLFLTHIVFFETAWHSGQANSPVFGLCMKLEQVTARWLFPLIITRRCFSLVYVLWNWTWQTSQCIAEIERDGVYSPQIIPFVFPIVILSALRMLPKLIQNDCKTLRLNIVNKIEL